MSTVSSALTSRLLAVLLVLALLTILVLVQAHV
jgi:hypothetical protein